MQVNNKQGHNYPQGNISENGTSEITQPNSSSHKITHQSTTKSTRGLRGNRGTNNTKLSARRALRLLNLPNIKDELKLRDPNQLEKKMTAVLSINVSDTKDKLQDLPQKSLSKDEKNAIAETIRNLDIIKSLQDSYYKDPKEFAKHLAIASGYISQQVEIPLTANTDEHSMQAAAHMVCWLEYAAFSVGKLDRTDGTEDTPKNIAIKMKVVNKQTNSILKQIQNIQKKNVHRKSVPWMRTVHIPRNNAEKANKKQWVQDTLRFGLDSPICKELHLTQDINKALENLKSIDPQAQSSTFFTTGYDETENLKNWNQAEELAVLITSRKTRGDRIHYRAKSQHSKALRFLMRRLDGIANRTQAKHCMDAKLSYYERLSVATAIDICHDKFDNLLENKLTRLDPTSAEHAKLKQLKNVRNRLKDIKFDKPDSHDEIRNAWWMDNVMVFSKLTPHLPDWELLSVDSESTLFVSWLLNTINDLNTVAESKVGGASEPWEPLAVTETAKDTKKLTLDEREKLSQKCTENIAKINQGVLDFKAEYKFPDEVIGLEERERWNGIGTTETVMAKITSLAFFCDNLDDQWYWQAKNWVDTMGTDIKSIAKQNFGIDLDLETPDNNLSDEQLQKKTQLIENIEIWVGNIAVLCHSKDRCTKANLEQMSRIEEEIKKNA